MLMGSSSDLPSREKSSDGSDNPRQDFRQASVGAKTRSAKLWQNFQRVRDFFVWPSRTKCLHVGIAARNLYLLPGNKSFMRRKGSLMNLHAAASADRHANRPRATEQGEPRGKCTMPFALAAVNLPKCRLSHARIGRFTAGNAIRPKEWLAASSNQEDSRGTAGRCSLLFIVLCRRS